MFQYGGVLDEVIEKKQHAKSHNSPHWVKLCLFDPP